MLKKMTLAATLLVGVSAQANALKPCSDWYQECLAKRCSAPFILENVQFSSWCKDAVSRHSSEHNYDPNSRTICTDLMDNYIYGKAKACSMTEHPKPLVQSF
jgi:hypothetical protein